MVWHSKKLSSLLLFGLVLPTALWAHSIAEHDEAAALWYWQWTIDPVSIFVVALALLYLNGSLNCRVTAWRQWCFWAGTLIAVLSLNSPVDYLADYSFTWHMVQHALIMMFAAPLILLGAPFVPIMRGVPYSLRKTFIVPLANWSWFRGLIRFVLNPITSLAIFALVQVVWHIPQLYDLALRNEFYHYLEHACFMVGAMLYFWNIIAPWPLSNRLSAPQVFIWIMLATSINAAIGASITWSKTLLYDYSENTVISMMPMEDQLTGGVLMWSMGGMMYFIVLMTWVGVLVNISIKEEQTSSGQPIPSLG